MTGGLLAPSIANPIAAALIDAILVFLSVWPVMSARLAVRQLLDRRSTPRPLKDVVTLPCAPTVRPAPTS